MRLQHADVLILYTGEGSSRFWRLSQVHKSIDLRVHFIKQLELKR